MREKFHMFSMFHYMKSLLQNDGKIISSHKRQVRRVKWRKTSRIVAKCLPQLKTLFIIVIYSTILCEFNI